MRFKVSNSEVCHKWAHQSQEWAEGPSIIFRGRQIFSYGRHFEMARHITGTRNRKAIIVTTNEYSVTTSKHLSYVQRATTHMTTFYLPLRELRIDDSNHPGMVTFAKEYAEKQIRHYLDKASRARQNKEWYLNCARQQAGAFNKFSEFLGNRRQITLPETFDAMLEQAKEQAKAISAANARRQAELAKRAAIEHERRMAEATANLALWKAGEINRFPYQHECPVSLRLIQDGKTIQTTLGAEFPIEHGKRAYRLLARLHARQETYQRNGHTIHCGQYAIDRADENGIRAGCHLIRWSESNEFANRAGWSIDDDSDTAENATDGHTPEDSGSHEATGRDAVPLSSTGG